MKKKKLRNDYGIKGKRMLLNKKSKFPYATASQNMYLTLNLTMNEKKRIKKGSRWNQEISTHV